MLYSNSLNIFDDYKRKYKYKISEFNSEIKTTKFEMPDDPNTIGEIDVLIVKPESPKIRAGFTGIVLEEYLHKVLFEGPSLSSTCTIPILKEENYEREFGYIQTTKMLFFEREYENATEYCDFHANLMHGQEEVLDSDGENNPFYSSESYFKVPAGPITPHSIELKLFDNPSSGTPKFYIDSNCQTLSKPDWGDLVKQERYQKFFVYLVMRSKQNNEDKWEYEVLFSFEWFIHLKWVKKTDKHGNFGYKCGLKEHPKPFRTLPKWIYSEEFYPCNKDHFTYSVNKTNVQFNIVNYPEWIYKHKLKRIYENIKINFSNMKIDFENIKLNISNMKKLCENLEKIEDLEENVVHIESINLEGKKVSDNLFECIEKMKLIKSEEYKERIVRLREAVETIYNYVKNNEKEKHKYLETCKTIAEGVKDLYNRIKSIDLGNIENCESSESISSEVNKFHDCNKIMDSIEDQFCKGFEGLILILDNLCEEGERNDNKDEIKFHEYFKKATLEIRKVNELIENMDLKKSKFPTIHDNINSQIWSLYEGIEILNVGEQIYEDLENLLLNLEKLCEHIVRMEVEENKMIILIDSYGRSYKHLECMQLKLSKFCEIYLRKLCSSMITLNSIMPQVFQHINKLLPLIEELKKDVEKLNSENEVFRKNFLSIFLVVKKLFACIQFMDLESYNYHDSYRIAKVTFPLRDENMNLEGALESWLTNVKNMCMMGNKFCQCNHLTETYLTKILKKKIIKRNKKDRASLSRSSVNVSVTV